MTRPVALRSVRVGGAEYLGAVGRRLKLIYPYCKWRNLLAFAFGALTQPAPFQDWFEYLDRKPPDELPPNGVALLTTRSARRYMRNRIKPTDVIDLLRRHYDLIGDRSRRRRSA